MKDCPATHTGLKLSVLPRVLSALILLLSLAASSLAQTTSTSASDSSTPKGLAPGAPEGSYELSGFEHINLYNGNLDFHLPLLHLGGRGSAGYDVTLALNTKKWSVRHSQTETTETWTPTHDWWADTSPGYGAGRMLGRKSGVGTLPTSGCPGLPQNRQFYQLTLTTITFTAPDGTEYDFRDQLNGGQRLNITGCPSSTWQGGLRGRVWFTADGSAATFISDTDIYDQEDIPQGVGPRTFAPSGYLMLRDGTRYRIDSGSVSWIRDRNGNQVTIGSPITDSLGRTVTIEGNVTDPTYGLCDRIHFNGFGGTQRTIYVTYASLGDHLVDRNVLRAGYSLQTYPQLFPELNGATSYGTTQYNPTVVTGVVLPNGQSYQFSYNSYGELARVVLPTGGAIEYDMTPASGVVEGWDGYNITNEIYRRVVERRTYKDGATLEGRTDYTEYTATPSGDYIEVDNYDGSTLKSGDRHYYSGGTGHNSFIQQTDATGYPLTYPAWDQGRETITEAYDTNGTSLTTVLRRITNTWQAVTMANGLSVNPRLVTTTTTIEPSGVNLVSKQTAINPTNGSVGFDQYNNQTDAWEYDYGTGAPATYPVRHTHTSFLTTGTINGTTYDYACDPNTTCNSSANIANVIHLRSLPTAQQVYAVNQANGAESTTPVAQSTTTYDEPSYVLAVYTTGVTGWTDPGTPARGDATTASHWLDTSSSWLSIHAQYDQVGNVTSTWDALGNQSQVSYTDAFTDNISRNTYAFPTSTTSPTPDPLGQRASSTSLTTSSVYDYSTGQLISATDANNQTTYARYTDDANNPDPLDRLRRVEYPDGGVTKYNYFDDPQAAGGLYLQTFSYVGTNQTRPIEARQYFDGLGRKTRASLYDGTASTPWVSADTYYDALGRTSQVSNPYRVATPSATVPPTCAACTVTTYDALNRIISVTTPDSAHVKTNYSGARVLVTDQQNRQRLSQTDALGRLTDVWEIKSSDDATEPVSFPTTPDIPTVSAGYHTSYFYDALGNLRKVQQGGQLRYFMYDSLSRLIRASNPEQIVNNGLYLPDTFTAPGDTPHSQWTMAYGYDANGNLSSKTDARNITTSYLYDNLNRVKQTNYSDGQTAYTLNTYDFATNGRGRFYANYESSTTGTINYITAYDETGRPTARDTDFYVSGTGWVRGYASTRQYDKVGHPIQETYPSGHTVNYNYDIAGRPGDLDSTHLAFTGNLGDGVTRTYAQGISYNERSQMQQEAFGTQVPLYHKLHYNVRGQLYDIRLSTLPFSTTNNHDQWDWNRGALLNYYSTPEFSAGSNEARALSGPDNNGNLLRGETYIPTDPNATYNDTTASTYALMQARYAYDQLNRLSSINEYQQGQTFSFAQAYSYDRWGNRTIDQANTTQSSNFPHTAFKVDPNGSNRLLVPDNQTGTIGYDPAGNLTTNSYAPAPGSSAANFTYDAENRLTEARDGNNQVVSHYTYDATGKRMRRLVNGVETWQIYGFDGELIAEYPASGAVTAPQKEYGYRGGELLVTASQPQVNFAAAANGGTISAQNYTQDGVYSGLHFQPAYAIDGKRYITTNGDQYWRDEHGLASWLEVDFNSTKSINEVDVFTVADYPAYLTQADPAPAQTFTQYGVTAFDVQYWTGSSWQTVPGGSITNNNLVWRKVSFAAVTTSKIRVVVNATVDGVARIAEVEAWGTALNNTSDAVADFSNAQNPNGAWSYGSQAVGGGFTLYPSHNNQFGSGLDTWSASSSACCPMVTKNSTGATASYAGGVVVQPTDLLNVHPGANGERSIVRWTAQAAGTVNLAGRFQGLDNVGTTTDVLIKHNGTTIFSGNMNGYGQTLPFALTRTVSAGDTLEFSVGYGANGTYNNDSTGLAVTLTTAAGAPADVEWLVPDQLGTPRMVADQSGSLSGIKRHDYLPFGEEISAGAGGRTAAQGYMQDDVRQKFGGGQEHDSETSLDFMQARYYSSLMGRFTSPDSVDGAVLNPQTLNLYAYVQNNPVNFNDPTGHMANEVPHGLCANTSLQCGPDQNQGQGGSVPVVNPLIPGSMATTDKPEEGGPRSATVYGGVASNFKIILPHQPWYKRAFHTFAGVYRAAFPTAPDAIQFNGSALIFGASFTIESHGHVFFSWPQIASTGIPRVNANASLGKQIKQFLVTMFTHTTRKNPIGWGGSIDVLYATQLVPPDERQAVSIFGGFTHQIEIGNEISGVIGLSGDGSPQYIGIGASTARISYSGGAATELGQLPFGLSWSEFRRDW